MNSSPSATCRVRFDGNDWKNVLSIQSPTGRTVSFSCNGRWNDLGDELRGLAKRLEHADDSEYRWGRWIEVEISYDAMRRALAVSRAK